MPRDRKGADTCTPDFMPPCTPKPEAEVFHGTPDMAELRYRLLVRRGQAWGNNNPLKIAL